MLKPIGLTEGHYECRSLDETLPIFTDLLAAEVIERTEKQAVVKHPNTAWRLVIHEGGPDSKNKPHTNHYGFRVANSKEIPKAHQYISDHKAQYKIKSVTPPHEAHFAYSIYFKEPGGNDLEIEYYNPAAIKQGRRIAAPHWTTPLPEEKFPGRGYVPQAMTHGTLNCDDKETSDKFLGQRARALDHRRRAHVDLYQRAEMRAVVRRGAADDAPRLSVGGQSVYSAGGDAGGSRRCAQRVLDQRQRARYDGASRAPDQWAARTFYLSDISKNWWEITS